MCVIRVSFEWLIIGHRMDMRKLPFQFETMLLSRVVATETSRTKRNINVRSQQISPTETTASVLPVEDLSTKQEQPHGMHLLLHYGRTEFTFVSSK
jgi:hypothetical protein